MQSFTAVAIVGIAAVLLGATAKLMGDTLRVIEIVSYSLIAVLGPRLMWIKGRGFLKAGGALRQREEAVTAVEPHARLHCRHDHDRWPRSRARSLRCRAQPSRPLP